MEGVLQIRLGVNLRRVRQARKLSQEAFGEQIGMHRTYVGSLERGKGNVTLQTLERLADRVGVDPVELLRED